MTDVKVSLTSGLDVRYFQGRKGKEAFKRGIWEVIVTKYMENVCRGAVSPSYVEQTLRINADLFFVLTVDAFDFDGYPSILERRFRKIRHSIEKHKRETSLLQEWTMFLTNSGEKRVEGALVSLSKQAFGFAILKEFDTRRWELDVICTLPQPTKERASYGMTLMQAIFDVSKQKGVPHIQLHSIPPAIGFYRKLGFKFGHDCGAERKDLEQWMDRMGKHRFERNHQSHIDPRMMQLFHGLAEQNLCWDSDGQNPQSVPGCMMRGAVMSYCPKRTNARPFDEQSWSTLTPLKYSLFRAHVKKQSNGSTIGLGEFDAPEFRFLVSRCFPNTEIEPKMFGRLYSILFGDDRQYIGEGTYPVSMFVVDDKSGEIYNACTQFCERGKGHFRRLLGTYLEDRQHRPDRYPKQVILYVDAKENLNAYATYVKLGFVGDESQVDGQKLSKEYRMVLPDRAFPDVIRQAQQMPSLIQLQPGDCYNSDHKRTGGVHPIQVTKPLHQQAEKLHQPHRQAESCIGKQKSYISHIGKQKSYISHIGKQKSYISHIGKQKSCIGKQKSCIGKEKGHDEVAVDPSHKLWPSLKASLTSLKCLTRTWMSIERSWLIWRLFPKSTMMTLIFIISLNSGFLPLKKRIGLVTRMEHLSFLTS